MSEVHFNAVHWIYIIGVLTVIATMILRKNVIIPCILFTFAIGLVYTGSFIGGVGTIFNASIVAAKDLFSIFMIIGVMVALLAAMEVTGADQVLVKPLKGFMNSPLTGYLVIILGTAFISLLFWPTPAVPLIGALLIPAAIRAGLPPIMCAVAIALAGQGMALGGDVIIQGAPGLTAKSAGVPVEMVTIRAGMLTAITGVVAITMAWIMSRKEIKTFAEKTKNEKSTGFDIVGQAGGVEKVLEGARYGKFAAGLMIAVVVGVVVSLFAFDIKGGDASALLGGSAFLVIIITSLLVFKSKGLDSVADFLGEGLGFAFKIMGPIIPIAGFFFIGSPESAPLILGKGAPGYLFDVGNAMASVISPTGFVASFGLLILGMITGLDGSGFSGLPLVGTLAAALGSGNQNITATLASIGQIGAIWSGGGTIVAWSSLVAVAGIAGVPVLDLVRKNFIPVITGMVVSTIVAVIFML
ncbi:MAG: membrane protein [Peptococcaceae bacterium BRH_c4a]|nr:MAG: membrane protein [Peptococcaceae bacterium BRH_c4a]